MQIRFTINYRTEWGENLFLHYGNGEKAAMRCINGSDGTWEVLIADAGVRDFACYHYEVEKDGRFER